MKIESALSGSFYMYHQAAPVMHDAARHRLHPYHKMVVNDMQHLSRKRLKKLLMAAGHCRNTAENVVGVYGRVMNGHAAVWRTLGPTSDIPRILRGDPSDFVTGRFVKGDDWECRRVVYKIDKDIDPRKVYELKETVNSLLEKYEIDSVEAFKDKMSGELSPAAFREKLKAINLETKTGPQRFNKILKQTDELMPLYHWAEFSKDIVNLGFAADEIERK